MNAILLTLPGAGVTYNVIYLVFIKIAIHVAVVLQFLPCNNFEIKIFMILIKFKFKVKIF